MKDGFSLGLDIDGVITTSPDYFAFLSSQWRNNGGRVHIVSSPSDRPDVIQATREELSLFGITYDYLYLLPSIEAAQVRCPQNNLDWYQKYLWQKVAYCLENNIEYFYDDDTKVIELFKSPAPQINIFHVVQPINPAT
jgi:hypothetical protein